jgi:uncharacterized protein (TIGR03435 family)
MHSLYRSLYRLLLSLHPAAFRREFARDMALDFDQAMRSHGLLSLYLDAAGSLVRQWSVAFPSFASTPAPAASCSLLAGNYAGIFDSPFAPIQLGLGLIASAAQIALCMLMLGAGHRHIHPLSIASTRLYTEAADKSADRESTSPASAPSNPEKALAQSAHLEPELLLLHPSDPLPTYDVATIKLLDPETARSMARLAPGATLSPLSIRRYLMDSYGAHYATQIVGGPDWLSRDEYLIQGKNSADLESAIQKMTREDRYKQIHWMGQSLLAERFHLKAHFETRVLPVYALEADKGGLKITAVPAPPVNKPGEPPIPWKSGDELAPGNMETNQGSNGSRILSGRAIQLTLLARILATDIGDRPIVNRTGFTGYFNVKNLTWVPLANAETSASSDAPSLPGALKDKLGIRIVSTNAPIEVLVIDRIDRPTPN